MHCFEFFFHFPGASFGEKRNLELLVNMILLEKELGNKDLCGVNLGSIHSQAMLKVFSSLGVSFTLSVRLQIFILFK